MTSLFANITLEVNSLEPISNKTFDRLRRELQLALNEAAEKVLEDMGIVNDDIQVIYVDEIDEEEVNGDDDLIS